MKKTRQPALCFAILGVLPACQVPVSSCGEEPATTCLVERIEVDGRSRTYVVSRRHGLDCRAGRRPLVLFFHGSGSNGSEARSDYAFFEDAIGPKALIVYPDGLGRPELGGRAGWNRDLDGDDVHLVDALLPRLAQDYCVDTAQSYAVGHSRGGRFVDVLGCSRGELFRGLAEASAGAPNVSTCPRRAPIWIAHGVDDEQVPFTEGERMRDDWASRNSCPLVVGDYPLDTCTTLPGCPADAPVVWCPYGGTMWGGHYPPPFFGRDVWAFFQRLGAT